MHFKILSAICFNLDQSKILLSSKELIPFWQSTAHMYKLIGSLTLPQKANFRFSKLKDFADDNSKFDKNGRNFSKRVENSEKKRNCSLREIYPFPKSILEA